MNDYTKKFIKEHFFEIIFSIPKTIFFNFKVLPICQAIKFPYIVSYHIKLHGVNRKTFISKDKKMRTASMRIGFGDSITSRRESPRGVLNIEEGGLIVVGNELGLSQGCVLSVKNAKITLGNHFRCNYSTTIDCAGEDIEIGDDVVFGWNVVLKNNDGHYVIENGEESVLSKKIVIHDHVWVCAFSTILKGTTLMNDSVVAYGSLLTKTIDKANVLYGGIPAKVVKENINWSE